MQRRHCLVTDPAACLPWRHVIQQPRGAAQGFPQSWIVRCGQQSEPGHQLRKISYSSRNATAEDHARCHCPAMPQVTAVDGQFGTHRDAHEPNLVWAPAGQVLASSDEGHILMWPLDAGTPFRWGSVQEFGVSQMLAYRETTGWSRRAARTTSSSCGRSTGPSRSGSGRCRRGRCCSPDPRDQARAAPLRLWQIVQGWVSGCG